MPEDYIEYWGMTKPPFALTPDPEMLYLTSQHAECLMRLKYAIFSQKGGALLVSDTAGNGKTTVLARLKRDLDEYYTGRVRVVFIDHPTVSPIEMIGEIAHQLGAELQTTEKIRALNSLRDRLFTLYNETIKVVVIVDEGQMLKDRPDVLGELRILLNFCVADAFLLTFIFSGQKPLDANLREMPEFWQRLPVRFFLKNLDYKDTKALLQYRLKKVGVTEEIFTEDAFQGIYRYSEGCPRVMCSVADLALVIGYAKGVKRIGFIEVSTACKDMESSGDGFHYYAYIKAQEQSSSSGVGHKPPQEHEREEPQKRESAHSDMPRAKTIVNTITCQSCFEANEIGKKFCEKCGTPLYKKCPKCFHLTDTLSDECPACHTIIEREMLNLIEKVYQDLHPLNILESGEDYWLQAKGITLEMGEKVLCIFPRGSFVTPGPHIGERKKGKLIKKPCDVLLTNRRVMLGIDDTIISSELTRVESCMVSDTGRVMVKRYELVLGLNGTTFAIRFPYGTSKNKTIIESISSVIQAIMLR